MFPKATPLLLDFKAMTAFAHTTHDSSFPTTLPQHHRMESRSLQCNRLSRIRCTWRPLNSISSGLPPRQRAGFCVLGVYMCQNGRGAGAVGGSLQSGSALVTGMTILSGQTVVFGVPSIGMGLQH